MSQYYVVLTKFRPIFRPVLHSQKISFVRVSASDVYTIKHHLGDLYQNTVKLDNLPADAILDAGDVSTLPKVARNTVSVPCPKNFAEVIHMDIVFGPEVLLGNVHYGLMFLDRYSRMTWIYPLQTLTSDNRKQ